LRKAITLPREFTVLSLSVDEFVMRLTETESVSTLPFTRAGGGHAPGQLVASLVGLQ
jgi:hypothetical protein